MATCVRLTCGAVSTTALTADPVRRREREGALLCVCSAVCFAGAMILGKLGHAAGVSTVSLLAVRFTLAAALLWAAAIGAGVGALHRRDALVGLLLGVLYAGQTALSFTALTRIDASLTELLGFAYPALVVLGAIALRHEAPSRRRLAALALAMGGVALVLAGGSAGALDPLGTACALGSAVLYAGYALAAGRVVGTRVPPLTLTALLCSGASVAFVLAGSAGGSLHLAMSGRGWACAIALAVCSTVLAITAFLGGVARVGAGRASILAMLEPPAACVLAFLVLGERLTAVQLLGGALVIGAAVVLQLRSVRSLAPWRFLSLRRSRRSSRARARRCPTSPDGPTSPSGTASARSRSWTGMS